MKLNVHKIKKGKAKEKKWRGERGYCGGPVIRVDGKLWPGRVLAQRTCAAYVGVVWEAGGLQWRW